MRLEAEWEPESEAPGTRRTGDNVRSVFVFGLLTESRQHMGDKLRDRKFLLNLDDRDLRSALAHVLRDEGATVHCADDEHQLRFILETAQPETAIVHLDKAHEFLSAN
jgi:hypothetical protein